MRLRARLLVLPLVVAAGVLGGASPAAASPNATAAKSCKPGYVKAGSKCLHSGQFCTRSKSYRQYGFKCVRGSDGRYRLRRA